MKLTRKLWLIDLKLDQQAFGPFIFKDPETNMSPIEMIFQHRCATAMLILLYGEFGKTNVIAHGFYELFLLSMRADYAVLDEHLWEIMYPYDEELFTQKKLHEVIPRFVKFYKDILRAKDQTGTSLIALFDTFKTSILADYHTLAEFFKVNVRLALVMVKMESLEFDYEFFELVFSMPGYHENAVKRLHDFMKQEFNDQRWLEFMQDLRQDQLNDKKVHVTMVDYAESVFGVRNRKNSVYAI